MEFKSQICTTKEQSNRLLELGLKPETADCFLEYIGLNNYANRVWNPTMIVNNFRTPDYSKDIPAWSLHRLMEIVMKGDKLGCITHNIHQRNVSSYYELVITSIEHLIKIDEFNKDYLEERK